MSPNVLTLAVTPGKHSSTYPISPAYGSIFLRTHIIPLPNPICSPFTRTHGSYGSKAPRGQGRSSHEYHNLTFRPSSRNAGISAIPWAVKSTNPLSSTVNVWESTTPPLQLDAPRTTGKCSSRAYRLTALQPSNQQMAFNPFFDTIRQNLELSRGATSHDDNGSKGSGIPLKLPKKVRERVGELPFEWLRSIARKSGKVKAIHELSEESSSSGSEVEMEDLPPSSSPEETSSTNSSAEDLTRALATQFYGIELGEQRRLMGVMEHHSKESDVVGPGPSMTSRAASSIGAPVLTSIPATRSFSYSGVPSTLPTKRTGKKKKSSHIFPFSITAGVEKGTKNR